MKRLLLCISLLLTLTIYSVNAKETFNESEFSQAQLAQMLAPIALYPDSLLTHILIASTYPIEVVEAERWVSKNSTLSAERMSKKLENKDWEPSVKALVMFPKVLERLSEDLSWTQQLGDAFLQDEEIVLQVIQDLRYQAQEAGNLDKMENVKITREKKNIIIQPVQKEVVYVPYYDTRHVYGDWHWSMNPPIHWDWGHHVSWSHRNPFRWHSGIHISFNYFFSAFHWHNRHVVVVDHRNTRKYRSKKHIVRGGYANRWVHKPQHRRGVTYRSERVNKRFKSHRPVVRKTVAKQHVGPKLYSHKKDYRPVKPMVKHHNKLHKNLAKHENKLPKHEVLQRKFKTHNTYNKPTKHVNKHKHTKVNKAINNKQTVRDRKELVQHKALQHKRHVNNKPSINTQHRTEKPRFNQSRSVQQTPKYTQPKREYSKPSYTKPQTKPQRSVQRTSQRNSNYNKPVRQSHSGARHSEKRRERH